MSCWSRLYCMLRIYLFKYQQNKVSNQKKIQLRKKRSNKKEEEELNNKEEDCQNKKSENNSKNRIRGNKPKEGQNRH